MQVSESPPVATLLAQAALLAAGEVARRVATKATVPQVPAYSATRQSYYSEVRSAIGDYLQSGDRSVTKYRNRMGRTILDSFSDAFYRGYRDVGGEDTEDDDEQWLTDRQQTELGYASQLFATLRESRDSISNGDLESINRADGYTATLDSVYAEGKLRGAANAMLTWRYGRTEHCDTCLGLNGQRHSAKWYLRRDYIPGKPGAAMDCHGYECQCRLVDDKGKRYTL